MECGRRQEKPNEAKVPRLLLHGKKTNKKTTKKFFDSISVGDNKTIKFLIVNLFHVSKQTNKQTKKFLVIFAIGHKQINK